MFPSKFSRNLLLLLLVIGFVLLIGGVIVWKDVETQIGGLVFCLIALLGLYREDLRTLQSRVTRLEEKVGQEEAEPETLRHGWWRTLLSILFIVIVVVFALRYLGLF